ncbi:MAG: hypothetical protein NTV46_00490, partial [Verrucomicrobia bacterium]|nr:hypothetical protein [Verrucomicrobiota bacterium]
DQLIRYPGYELGLITNAGTLRKSAATGTTTINIPVNNSGTVEALVGTINFNSEYSGTLSASLAGTTAGTDYGKIQFSQPPHFSGPFTLTLRNGFLPLTGDTFDIASFPSATGDFSDFVGLDLGNGLHLAPHFEGGGLTLVTTFQPLQTVPTLTISRTVSGVFLRWPGEYTNWALYRSIDLKTWEPATVSGANSTVVPAVLPKEFFRLHELP